MEEGGSATAAASMQGTIKMITIVRGRCITFPRGTDRERAIGICGILADDFDSGMYRKTSKMDIIPTAYHTFSIYQTFGRRVTRWAGAKEWLYRRGRMGRGCGAKRITVGNLKIPLLYHGGSP